MLIVLEVAISDVEVLRGCQACALGGSSEVTDLEVKTWACADFNGVVFNTINRSTLSTKHSITVLSIAPCGKPGISISIASILLIQIHDGLDRIARAPAWKMLATDAGFHVLRHVVTSPGTIDDPNCTCVFPTY